MAKLKMVHLTDPEIEGCCKKFKLERARYNDEKIKLEQKKDKDQNHAYSEEQINRLILRYSSENTVAAVTCLHDDLIGYGLTPQNIYSMAAHDGGSKNLEALMYFK